MPDSRRQESPESINGAVGPNVEAQETDSEGEVTGGSISDGKIETEQDIDENEGAGSEKDDDDNNGDEKNNSGTK